VAALGGMMFEALARWIPGLDPATGTLAVPPWAAAIGAVLLAFFCLFVLIRCLIGLARYMPVVFRYLRSFGQRTGRPGPVVVCLVLVLSGVALVWFIFAGLSKSELAAERRALDARSFELATRSLMPGSALACLDAGAGDTVEASCEKALFATPESTANAVSYVAAQLALLADASDFARRDRSYAAELVNLRRAVASDRFGLVAHVLAARHDCIPDRCRAFALLNDASRVKSNLAERTYEFYVVRYAAGWPPIAKPPVATASPPAATAPPPAAAAAMSAPASAAPPPTGSGIRPPGPNVFFPSSTSTPLVSNTNAEPQPQSQERQTTSSIEKPPMPPRRPALPTVAATGSADAQTNLGLIRVPGRGGPAKDDREAARLYKLAADQGNADAQTNLGIFYATGRGGLAKDDREAARLYKLAADQGNAGGRFNLGTFYEQGRGGLAKDDHEAARLYKLSADQGNAFAQTNLGTFYAQGRGGLAKDDSEAAPLFKLAADQGNAGGQTNLGIFYAQGRGGLAKDDREAARLYKLSADQGNDGGQANLGFFYEQGRGGLAKDDREAAQLYRLSADQGNAYAQSALARLAR
jgi:TPR repeat protein